MSSPENVSFVKCDIIDDFWWFGIRYLVVSITFSGCKPSIVSIPIDCDRNY